MRQLSATFLAALIDGHLSALTQAVRADHDLDLEIRSGYLNIYYKGNALLKLDERRGGRYRVAIHEKFAGGLDLPTSLDDAASTAAFVRAIPLLKQHIILHGRRSLEIEYEQLIIRANNFEPRNNSEYFILDRQYAVGSGRFDLTGIFWDRANRQRNRVADLCLMEIKFALNPDISEVDLQLTRYYELVVANADLYAQECEGILRQKLALGLIHQDARRLAAMRDLTISHDPRRCQFILFLVDYNPNSSRLDLAKLKALPFADQVRIYMSGFAMWQQNVRPVEAYGG